SALGVGAGVQSGLMDKIARKASKKFGGEALAAADPNFAFSNVEILLRAGFQMNSLFPSLGHTTAVASQSPALNIYSSPAKITPHVIGGSMPVYTANFVAGTGADALGTQVAAANGKYGLATSECVSL